MTSAVQSRRIARAEAGKLQTRDDWVAIEEPMEIRIGERSLAVTMRTPGHDFELAAGFLFTEGILEKKSDLLDLRYCVGNQPVAAVYDRRNSPADGGHRPPLQNNNLVTVRLAANVKFDPKRSARNFFASSSCGVCGKATIDSLQITCPPIRSRLKIPLPLLYSLDAKLREAQSVFQRTGALHAAALFDAQGTLLMLREDVGRHNAVDKIIGAALLENKLPLDRHLLMVSGRAGFEIVQKTLRARIPILAAVGGPSSLAVEVAENFGMTLIGFLRGKRCNIYSGKQRLMKGMQ